MEQLVFATNNLHKVEEMRRALAEKFEIISLKEAGIEKEIPEPFNTLEENALEKAKVIFDITGFSCFSEDTGLEVEALGGEPGVKSARYAGDTSTFDENITKLLQALTDYENRKARFRTVICLIMGGEVHYFEGICVGNITLERRGTAGFGYDAVFVPEGSNATFAEMNPMQKNSFSHRRKAADGLVAFLQDRMDLHNSSYEIE